MNPNAIQRRLARLQRECHASAGPALLLCAACAVLVLMSVMNAAGADFSASVVQGERSTRVWACGGDATSRACQLALQAR